MTLERKVGGVKSALEQSEVAQKYIGNLYIFVSILPHTPNEINAYARVIGNELHCSVTEAAVELFTEGELLAVLGHEISHLLNPSHTPHLFRGLLFTTVLAAPVAAAAHFSGIHLVVGAVIAVALIFYGILRALLEKKISRNEEYRADALGAAVAGPQFMASALAKLPNESASWLATHPSSLSRIERIGA
ncbi:MAG: M48 family metalloprotease [Bdellovibrionales bacterium]|jgi:Zn-dependent protease with chaperone function|nr:M48 family metalloprotease [Bdellovibrionales bacterium]MBT3525745.1 M48 family metalloprotease [Bdellovibrionales bacterium]MBT7670142.1 M48 family metalloprotease [Bdellovibrionales bacterium]MBT7768065.1 M48 family metalloprotease [Bdellovibrionales bacterium]